MRTRKLLLALMAFVCFSLTLSAQQSVGIGTTTPHVSSILDLTSTTKGALIPRMSTAQRNAIAAPATGLLVYDGNLGSVMMWDGAKWVLSLNDNNNAWDYFSGSGTTGEIYRSGNVALGTYTDPDDYGLNVQHYYIPGGKSAVRGANQSGATLYAVGELGMLNGPAAGLPVYAWNNGVVGIRTNASGGNGAGVYGWNNDGANADNYGGLFVSDGTGANTNNGIYALADNGGTNYAGNFKGRVYVEGHNASGGAPDSLATVLESRVTHTQFADTWAIYGSSVPRPGYGYGIRGEGGWRGVDGYANASDYTGFAYGVFGSTGGTGVGTRIGIYGTASGGATNWAGYFAGDVYVSSDMRIATTAQATGYELSVNGQIACEEVLVQDDGSWPDYVFADDYALMPLTDVENFIKSRRHLPGIPSATEVEEEGQHLGDMQKRIMEKLEELTLYTIDQEKEIRALKERLDQVEQENVILKKQLDK